MSKYHFSITINDNEFLLWDIKKNKIFNKRFKSLKKDQIINIPLFSKELSHFFREFHIHLSLFGYKLIFIKPLALNVVLLEKYLEIFNDYFRKIEVVNIEEILKIDKNISYLNINHHYLDYYYLKKNKLETLRVNKNLFNNNTLKTIKYLFTAIFKSKRMIVFGNDENIPSVVEELNHNYNIIATFPEFHHKYILEEYKKK